MKIVQLFLTTIIGVSMGVLILSHVIAQEPMAIVSYPLPTVNILPDHPLYKITVLRDKLMLRLIINPVKKVEYYLILSDQGLAASIQLAEKGKAELAKQTAIRAEHYYTQLVSDYKWLVWYHRQIPEELTENIFLAADKHQEVLTELGFTDALDFSRRNEQTLREFIADEAKKRVE